MSISSRGGRLEYRFMRHGVRVFHSTGLPDTESNRRIVAGLEANHRQIVLERSLGIYKPSVPVDRMEQRRKSDNRPPKSATKAFWKPSGRNHYELRADHAVIFLDRRDGSYLECLVDIGDLERILAHPFKWHGRWSGEAKTFYVGARSISGTSYILLHRFITQPPRELQVDHGDHSGLNNRRGNLCICTSSQNCLNRRTRTGAKKTSSTPYKGVCFVVEKQHYRVQVSINGMRRDLPCTYSTAEEAAIALEQFNTRVLEVIESFSPIRSAQSVLGLLQGEPAGGVQ